MDLSEFNILPMKINDIEEVKNIEKNLNINILSFNSIKNDLNNNNCLYYVLKTNNNININNNSNNNKLNKEIIVGYIATSYVIDTMDILSIVISKEYQKIGLASYLIKYIISLAKEKNIKKIFLEVRKNNTIAQKLYSKFNFEYINTRKNYYFNPIDDALIYVLNL